MKRPNEAIAFWSEMPRDFAEKPAHLVDYIEFLEKQAEAVPQLMMSKDAPDDWEIWNGVNQEWQIVASVSDVTMPRNGWLVIVRPKPQKDTRDQLFREISETVGGDIVEIYEAVDCILERFDVVSKAAS